MTTGVGYDAQFGYEIEGTDGTYQAVTKFVGMVQESFTNEPDRPPYPGIYAGRVYPTSTLEGNQNVSGSVRIPLQAETIGKLLRMCLGGTISTSGADPYAHELTGGDIDFGATFQFGMPGTGGTVHPKNLLGTKVNQWTLEQNAGDYTFLQLDCLAREMEKSSSLVTFAPDAAPTPLTFSHLVLTTPSGAVCPDSFTVTGNNNLDQRFAACATDAGKATIRPGGVRTVTGSATIDFADLTEDAYYEAGTLGNLTAVWTNGASAILNLDLNVQYTGVTPTVSDMGVMKQQIDFQVVSATSDADAITVTLTNDEATA